MLECRLAFTLQPLWLSRGNVMPSKLTKSLIERTAARDKPVVLFDTQIPGFAAKITMTGRKVFQLRYRLGGRQTRLRTYTIGQFGRPWTVELARREAQALLGDVRRGLDPAAEKARKRVDERSAVDIETLSREFLELYCKTKLKARSYVEYERAFRKYINPRLGSIKVRDLSHGDVGRLHHSMRATAITANRTHQVLSKFLSWAIRGGYRPDGHHPCKGFEKFKEQPRQRYLTNSEIGAVGAAIARLEGAGRLSPWQAALFRCLLLTGMRSSELRLLRWSWVDFDAALFRLPDSKVGKRDIPMPAPVMDILRQLPRVEGCPYVFAGRATGKPLANTRWPWKIIVSAAGIEAARVHDLRHTAASVGVAAGVSLTLIGGVLGHKSHQTTARYAHLSDDPVRASSETIAERVARALEGAPAVVQSRRRS
jgi:integrase